MQVAIVVIIKVREDNFEETLEVIGRTGWTEAQANEWVDEIKDEFPNSEFVIAKTAPPFKPSPPRHVLDALQKADDELLA
jgi:hypothetical protein